MASLNSQRDEYFRDATRLKSHLEIAYLNDEVVTWVVGSVVPQMFGVAGSRGQKLLILPVLNRASAINVRLIFLPILQPTCLRISEIISN